MMRVSLIAISLIMALYSCALSASCQISPDGLGDYFTIQDAIWGIANGDTIFLTEGVYTGDGNRDIDSLGKSFSLLYSGSPSDSCVIDCNGSQSDPHRALLISNLDNVSIVIEGITFCNAYVLDNGGVFMLHPNDIDEFGVLHISQCTFINNHAMQHGGVLYAWTWSPLAVIHLMQCIFINNSAGMNGGALLIAGHGVGGNITDCMFAYNNAHNGGAMAFGVVGGHIYRCVFTENISTCSGGAVLSLVDAISTYEECVFRGNTSPAGGAISTSHGCVYNGDVVDEASREHADDFRSCIFEGNHAGQGGAVYSGSGSFPNYYACRFIGNTATQGGAVFATELSYTRYHDCIFVDNMAEQGGAICEIDVTNWCPDCVLPIERCTFVANGAAEGSALYLRNVEIPPYLDRSIISQGIMGEAIYYNNAGDITIRSCNIYGNEGGDWIGAIAGEVEVNGNFSANPCFCDLDSRVLTLCADSWCLAENHPWGYGEQVGAFSAGCDSCECGGPVATFLTQFTAQPIDGTVMIAWSVDATDETGQFRLIGTRSDTEWEVPFHISNSRTFTATDRSPQLATRGTVLYSLHYRETGQEWQLLAREMVDVPGSHLQTRLIGVHPNPFNPRTSVSFSVGRPQRVTISIFDMTGRHVAEVTDRSYGAGSYSVEWDGCDASGGAVSSGAYIARLANGNHVDSRKLLLLR